MDLELVTEQEAQNILQVRKYDSGNIQGKDTSMRPLVVVENLPSNFKGYPEGTVISYDPITLNELEALNNSSTTDIERGIAMLLKAIHCNTLPSEELYYWDVMYIGIQRKILAFGDTRGVTYAVCPNCGKVLQREFDYTELEFKELQAEDLPIITKLGGKEVEISLLTMREFLELSDLDSDLSVYAAMIKNLDREESLELVKNAYGKDAKIIRYIDRLLNYGLKPLKVQCTGEIIKQNPNYDAKNKESKKEITELCNEIVDVEVRSPFEVVFPEDEVIGHLDFEIQFGRK